MKVWMPAASCPADTAAALGGGSSQPASFSEAAASPPVDAARTGYRGLFHHFIGQAARRPVYAFARLVEAATGRL